MLRLGLLFLFCVVLVTTYFFLDFSAAKQTTPSQDKSILKKVSGKIAYQSNEDGDWELFVMRADGKGKKKLTENKASDEYPRWSYDGKWIAFVSDRDGNKEIYRMEVSSQKTERLTDHPAEDLDPDWSPKGTHLVLTSKRDGKDDLYLLEIATKKVERLTDNKGRNALASFSPDGKKLAFTSNRLVGWSIYLLDLETKETKKIFSGWGACRPDWSSDGKWLSFVSQQDDGKGDIYVMRPDGSEVKRITSTDATYDYFPSWSGDNKHIVFSRTENKKKGPWDLVVSSLESGTECSLTQTPFSESFPDWTKTR